MHDNAIASWRSKLTRGFVIVIFGLVFASFLVDSEGAALALRAIVQLAIIAYGIGKGYRHVGWTVPAIASALVVIGGVYGCYLVWSGDQAFTDLLYLGLVGIGLLGIRAQDTR